MRVYRIVKSRARVNDLSGTGSFINGGRWNFEGTYALYTSEYRSLALLETIVHTDEADLPSHMFILCIEFLENLPVYEVKAESLNFPWRSIDNNKLRMIGTEILQSNQFIAIKAPSAVLPQEFNYILNPSYPGFEKLVHLIAVESYEPDERLQ
jgi:RES domain-containing protein